MAGRGGRYSAMSDVSDLDEKEAGISRSQGTDRRTPETQRLKTWARTEAG